VPSNVLLLGVDGGGTCCRARLADSDGTILGYGEAGPANVRFGIEKSFSAVIEATERSLREAGLQNCKGRIVACLALAGASEPITHEKVRGYPHPFRRVVVTNDARAACIGAHAGRDGGIVIAGTGSIGWAILGGVDHQVGGWGFPISDAGSGAWLGCAALARLLKAHDGLLPWTKFLRVIFEQFESDPHAVVRWTKTARPRDYASFAPGVVGYAAKEDPVAIELMQMAGIYIDAIAARLLELGARRLAIMGGLAQAIRPYLSGATTQHLVQPLGDALTGALHLARCEAVAHITG
jgi:glucosamine kinase